MKNNNVKGWQNAIAMIGIALALILAHSPAAIAASLAPHVQPVSATPYGKTYGQWSAEHWKWEYSLPVDHHPLYDTADCSAGQTGQVWFLGGTFTVQQNGNVVVGTANRNCTVPTGKALFFPIIDAECSTIEGNGTTEAVLRACAQYYINHVTEKSAEVDNQPVQNLNLYRVSSPLFTFGPLPANNILGATAGATSPSVSDGYFVMLTPLSAGSHTVHFTGTLLFTQAQDGFDFTFSLDITYNLTVAN